MKTFRARITLPFKVPLREKIRLAAINLVECILNSYTDQGLRNLLDPANYREVLDLSISLESRAHQIVDPDYIRGRAESLLRERQKAIKNFLPRTLQ